LGYSDGNLLGDAGSVALGNVGVHYALQLVTYWVTSRRTAGHYWWQVLRRWGWQEIFGDVEIIVPSVAEGNAVWWAICLF
jgi:hypothetical protein